MKTGMTTAAFLVGLCLLSVSCGSSPPAPSQNTTTTTTIPATRIIGLSGTLTFGDVLVGSSADATFTITNSGNSNLTVSSLGGSAAGLGVYTASWASGTIAPGATQDVRIRFTPVAAVNYNAVLAVLADSTSGTNTINVSAAGSAASRVTLAGIATANTTGGARISGAIVRILDGPNVAKTTTTGDNGDYRLTDLAVGNANLQAQAPGYATATNGVFINGANALNFVLVKTAPTPIPTPGPNGATCPAASVPTGTTAVCNDQTFSQSQNRSGTCSTHGGVLCWICPGPLCTP